MIKRYNLGNIYNLNERKIFFDANIILYIFWPTDNRWEVKEYTSIFNNLYKQKNEMFIDFIVISEVVNRAIKIEYDKYIQKNNFSKNKLSYKKYRDSKEGQNTINDVYQIIKNKIVSIFSIKGEDFKIDDIENFLQVTLLDFSDKGIEAICKKNNYILLTHDRDFVNSDLEILSLNKKLREIENFS